MKSNKSDIETEAASPKHSSESSGQTPWLEDLGSRSINFSLDYDVELRLGTMMKVVMAAVVVTAGSVALIAFSAQPALAVGVTANDVSLSTADGEITAVNISPTITVDWTDLDRPVERVYADISVTEDTSLSYVFVGPRKDLDCSVTSHPDCNSRSGTTTFNFSELNLTASSTYGGGSQVFNHSMFAAAENSTKTTTVYVKIEVYAADSDGIVMKSKTITNQFDVSVTNKEGTLSLSGAVNSDVTG